MEIYIWFIYNIRFLFIWLYRNIRSNLSYEIYSDHQKLQLSSYDLKLLQKNILITIEYFNKYADNNDILYTAIAGTLIGAYVHKGIIQWDDDADIAIRKCDWHKFENLWISSSEEKTDYNFVLDTRWISKIVTIYDKQFIMYKNKSNPGWYKLKLPQFTFTEIDVGGIDIGYIFKKGNKYYESINKQKIAPKITYEDNNITVPYIPFSSTKIRAVKKKIGEQYLNDWYGVLWEDPRHPKIKKSRVDGILKTIKN